MCLYGGFKALYSLKFFHLSRFRDQISPPNEFLGKFRQIFSTLTHYIILQSMQPNDSTSYSCHLICTIQDCMVQISIPK